MLIPQLSEKSSMVSGYSLMVGISVVISYSTMSELLFKFFGIHTLEDLVEYISQPQYSYDILVSCYKQRLVMSHN